MEFIQPYKVTVFVLGLTGLLFFLQLLIADMLAIKAKHTPGFVIEQNHDSFLFRSNRVFANSTETAAILILFALFGMLSLAEATWLNGCAVVYLVGRIGHMFFYYANLQLLRSAAFVISLVGLLGMFIAGLMNWL